MSANETTLTPYDESCMVPPIPTWSETEKWVWQEICEGRIADFNQRYGNLSPKTPNGWPKTREITPSFLEAILTRDPYQKALARQGVRIIGAWIRGRIDLESASLSHQWRLGRRLGGDTRAVIGVPGFLCNRSFYNFQLEGTMRKTETISRGLLLLVCAIFVSVFILSSTNGLAQTPTGIRIQGGDTWSTYSDMKMVLKFDEPKPVSVDPAKTILQIVDMQEYFVGPKQRENMWRGDNNIKNVKSLLELARKLDMNVVYQYSMGITNPYEKRQKASPFKLYGPIIDELKPLNKGKEYFVPKSTHDIFFHTTMDDLLKTFPKEIDTVILTGTLTHVCVLYAVSGYCVRGYRVIVPMDGVIDDTPENQAMTLHVMSIRSANYPATITLSNMITFEPAPQIGK